jgi:hypothetical protein
VGPGYSRPDLSVTLRAKRASVVTESKDLVCSLPCRAEVAWDESALYSTRFVENKKSHKLDTQFSCIALIPIKVGSERNGCLLVKDASL